VFTWFIVESSGRGGEGREKFSLSKIVSGLVSDGGGGEKTNDVKAGGERGRCDGILYRGVAREGTNEGARKVLGCRA